MPTQRIPGVLSPIAEGMNSLLKVMMGAPDDATTAVRRGSAEKIARENAAAEALGALVSGYKPGAPNIAELFGTALRGGINPSHVSDSILGVTANALPVDDPRVSQAGVGAKVAFGSTPTGFGRAQATEIQKQQMSNDAALARAQFELNNKPTEVMTPQGPRIVRMQEAIGQMPLAPESNVRGGFLAQNFGNVGALPQPEQRILGAESRTQPTPRNYIAGGQSFITYDGVTDARSGQPLPSGGYIANAQGTAEDVGLDKAVGRDLQRQDIALRRMAGISNYARNLISDQNVGAAGRVKEIFQDTSQLAANLAAGLGYTGMQEALTDLQSRAQQGGVSGGTLQSLLQFDKTLPQLGSAYAILTMAAADALAGGMGRASDRDMRIITQVLGDPRALFSTPESLNARLDAVNDIINRISENNAFFRGGGTGAAASATSAPASGAPATPQATPTPSAERWERGPDGRPRRVQ